MATTETITPIEPNMDKLKARDPVMSIGRGLSKMAKCVK